MRLDDGKQVFIEFPRGISQGEMLPLFVVGPEGATSGTVELLRGNYMIVDRFLCRRRAALRRRSQPEACADLAHRTEGRRQRVRSNPKGEGP